MISLITYFVNYSFLIINYQMNQLTEKLREELNSNDDINEQHEQYNKNQLVCLETFLAWNTKMKEAIFNPSEIVKEEFKTQRREH